MEPSNKRRKLASELDEENAASDLLLLHKAPQAASPVNSNVITPKPLLQPPAAAAVPVLPAGAPIVGQPAPLAGLLHGMQGFSRIVGSPVYVAYPITTPQPAPQNITAPNRYKSASNGTGVYSTPVPLPTPANAKANKQSSYTFGLIQPGATELPPPPPKLKNTEKHKPVSFDDGFGTFENGKGDLNKRNKFFYKELRDHLESHARQSIGFLNDWFFIMDPKLHVGPINRDGTFEKRVRLHFIEWLELKHTNLWICWGTLLDTSYLPVFREGSSVYRIPGNQSSVFKTNRSFQGWNVGDDEQKKALRAHATLLKQELEAKWDGVSATEARRLCANVPLPKIPRPADRSDTPENESLQSNQHSQNASNTVSTTPTNLSPETTIITTVPDNPLSNNVTDMSTSSDKAKLIPPEELAADVWRQMGYTPEMSVPFDANFKQSIANIIGLTNWRDELINVFKLFASSLSDVISFDQFKLTIKRFGFGHSMFQRMLDLLATEAFNGEMTLQEAEEELLQKDVGTYLIRYSQSTPEHFVVCWRLKDKIDQLNNIRYNSAGKIEVTHGTETVQHENWKALIESSVAFMSEPHIAESRAQYKAQVHKIPIQQIQYDERYGVQLREDSQTEDRSGEEESTDSSKALTTSQMSTSSPKLDNNTMKMQQHKLLQFLGELVSTGKLDIERFSTWAPTLAAVESASKIQQLYTLYEVFQASPDKWIHSASRIIEGTTKSN